MKKRTSSDGTTGEKMFLLFANLKGFQMTRTQPETKIVRGRDGIIKTIIRKRKKDEMEKAPPDFLGCDSAGYHYAVEVKEAHGNTMPASRVDMSQRRYLADLPAGCSWVYVWWVDHGTGMLYPFIEKGSYKCN